MLRALLPVLILFSLFSIESEILAQKEAYQMIGEKMSAVLKTFGKPAYHDKSDPEMECVFYQTKSYRMVFVANREGVYQIEKCLFYNGKKNACNEFETLLNKCKDCGMTADSLDTFSYELRGNNVEVTLSLFENSASSKYEVRLKANRREG